MSVRRKVTTTGAMFTPEGRTRSELKTQFSGFDEEGKKVGEMMMRKRLIQVESEVESIKERMAIMESEMLKLVTERDVWKNAYDELAAKMTLNEKKTNDCEEKVKELNVIQEIWKKEKEEEKIDFRKIVEEQNAVSKSELSKEVVRVIKEKQEIVRDAVEKKKTVVVFGMVEEHTPAFNEREKKERNSVEDLFDVLQDNKELTEEIEEYRRLGRYQEGGHRPIKIRLRSQVAAEELLVRAKRLARMEKYKKVWIKREMNREEREAEQELRQEAKEKNEARSEMEKKRFYWKVIDMKLRRWYLKREEAEAVV